MRRGIKYNPITMPGVTLKDRAQFRRALLRWYKANRRELPWRRTQDPYRVWISEIMLQQTRVAAVIERYRRFLRRFPSVRALARASENSVLAEWSGLGYYRRARNLHAAARTITRECSGRFPSSLNQLRMLPGVGRYTAAAVASIAFGESVAVVDGNVERVLGRLLKRRMSGEQVWSAAQEILDEHRPGDFNQAMMELGATVCLPAKPRCGDCPIRKFCSTRGASRGRSSETRQQKREIGYRLARRGDAVLLVRRAATERLMPGMWELPEIRLPHDEREGILFSLSHSITVTTYKVRVVGMGEGSSRRMMRSGAERWIRSDRLAEIPLTGLARKILRRAEVIGIQ